ncbi:MAG: hypothetical protein ACK559_02430, partial [bacterium]
VAGDRGDVDQRHLLVVAPRPAGELERRRDAEPRGDPRAVVQERERPQRYVDESRGRGDDGHLDRGAHIAARGEGVAGDDRQRPC